MKSLLSVLIVLSIMLAAQAQDDLQSQTLNQEPSSLPVALPQDEATQQADGKEPDEISAIRKQYKAAMRLGQDSKNRIYRQESIKVSDSNVLFNVIYIASEHDLKNTVYIATNSKDIKDHSNEYLFDKDTSDLIFAHERYTDKETQQQFDLRCYFHNNNLIHSKSSDGVQNNCENLQEIADKLKKNAHYASHLEKLCKESPLLCNS